MEQQGKGGGTVERTLLLDKNTGLTSCASPATPEDSTRSDALEPMQGRKFCRTEETQLEEEEEKAEYTVFMDAVALSFLHAECCPWRNSFIPLASIHLEGAAVQPTALISQWTNRVQQLRRTGAAAGSPSQTGRYPCLTLQSARAFLLSALIAAAEAAAEAHARAGASVRATAFGAKAASLEASPVQQAAGPSEAPEGGASNKEVTNAGGVQQEKEAGDTSKETSCCTRLLDASYFLSSPHSPLQDACVSHLSPREVQMLRQLWLILSKNDGASETLVRQYIPSGTVIPPVCASSLLLERKCALQEGSEKYKEADEYLSLPILDTLLQQVAALLFDPRVPLPGSPGPSSLLMSKNSLSDELSSAPFTFPKEHESVQVDCDKLLAFFGWGPVTDCTKSEQQRRSTAAEGDRQQQRQKTGATLNESDPSRSVPPEPEEHEIERPQPLQRAGAPAEQREPKSDQEQQNQSIGLNTVAVVSRSNDDGKLVAATAGEVTVDEQKSPAVLQCLYCFRRVDLRNYGFSAEDACISNDSRWNVLTSEKVGILQKNPKIGAGNMLVEGWQQRTQISGNDGTQRIELRKGSNRTETIGEECASARDKVNGEQRQENAARKSTGAHSADSVATTVSCGGKSTGEGNNLVSGYPCINVNVMVEVEERQNKDADNSKELERDTSVGGTQVHTQPTQATHILGTERTYRRRKREAQKTTVTSSMPSLDPVCTHRLHCPFVSNAVYKDKLPIVLRLFFSLLPVLIETLQLQVEKRRLEAEIKETWSFRKRCQRSAGATTERSSNRTFKNHHT